MKRNRRRAPIRHMEWWLRAVPIRRKTFSTADVAAWERARYDAGMVEAFKGMCRRLYKTVSTGMND